MRDKKYSPAHRTPISNSRIATPETTPHAAKPDQLRPPPTASQHPVINNRCKYGPQKLNRKKLARQKRMCHPVNRPETSVRSRKNRNRAKAPRKKLSSRVPNWRRKFPMRNIRCYPVNRPVTSVRSRKNRNKAEAPWKSCQAETRIEILLFKIFLWKWWKVVLVTLAYFPKAPRRSENPAIRPKGS